MVGVEDDQETPGATHDIRLFDFVNQFLLAPLENLVSLLDVVQIIALVSAPKLVNKSCDFQSKEHSLKTLTCKTRPFS